MSDRIRSAGVARPAAADGPLQCAAVQVAGQQLSVAATRRTLARIEDLFGGHLPAPIESKVTQKRLQPARSRLSMVDPFSGAPVARITVIR
jgi:3-methyladenine DNA glycosylase/8-oxoguanine DNA glycosylase